MKHVQVSPKGRVVVLKVVLTLIVTTMIVSLMIQHNFLIALQHTAQLVGFVILIPAAVFAVINLALAEFT